MSNKIITIQTNDGDHTYKVKGPDSPDDVIGIFNEDKGPVIVYKSGFQRLTYLHVRKFWEPTDPSTGKPCGYFVPTKSGACIPIEEVGEFADALYSWAVAYITDKEHSGGPLL